MARPRADGCEDGVADLASIDPSGVFASRIQGAQMLGYVASPAMAGWLLDYHLGFARLLALFREPPGRRIHHL